MNELEKAYEEIERWHCWAEQEGFAVEEEISYLDYVKNYINNLQSKINKANEYVNNKDNWKIDLNNISITKEENIYINKNELLDILKEDK